MSMYGDVLNKLDDGLFVKIEPGRPVKLRILDHPKVSVRTFQDGNSSTKFAWPVWDYTLQKVRILEHGKSVFKGVAAIVENWPNGEAMPAPFDVVITRKGSGQYDTEYTVTGAPHDGSMPSSNTLKLPEVRGIALSDVVAGELPPVLGTGSDEVKELPSGAKSDDVVLTAEDMENVKPEDYGF